MPDFVYDELYRLYLFLYNMSVILNKAKQTIVMYTK